MVCAQQRDQDRGQQPYKTVSGTAATIPAAPGPQPGRREGLGEAVDSGASANPAVAALATLQGQWAELPAQYKLVFATSLSFVICNMDKVGAPPGQPPCVPSGVPPPPSQSHVCSNSKANWHCCLSRFHLRSTSRLQSWP